MGHRQWRRHNSAAARPGASATRRRAEADRRAFERARFIVQAVAEHGIKVGVVDIELGPSVVSTWAPSAPTPALQVACQDSFRNAIEEHLATIRRWYARERRRPTRGN